MSSVGKVLKQILFFAIVLFLLFAVQFVHTFEVPQWKEVFVSMVGLGILLALYYGAKVCSSSEKFNFEVTPEKQCDGGPYMYSSAPDHVKKYCNKLLSSQEGVDQYNMYNCNGLYAGRPLNFPDFVPPSNDMWENKVCKQQSFNGPAVL